MDLVLEIGGWDSKIRGDFYQSICFFEIAGKRFFANDTLNFGSTFYGFGDVVHYLDASEVGGENGDDIDNLAEFGDTIKDLGVTEACFASHFSEGFGSLRCVNSGKFDVSNII